MYDIDILYLCCTIIIPSVWAVIFGPYWSHVSQAWAQRNHPNMHIMFFEKMMKNTKEEFERLNKFLGTSLTSDQIDNVSQCETLLFIFIWLFFLHFNNNIRRHIKYLLTSYSSTSYVLCTSREDVLVTIQLYELDFTYL